MISCVCKATIMHDRTTMVINAYWVTGQRVLNKFESFKHFKQAKDGLISIMGSKIESPVYSEYVRQVVEILRNLKSMLQKT